MITLTEDEQTLLKMILEDHFDYLEKMYRKHNIPPPIYFKNRDMVLSIANKLNITISRVLEKQETQVRNSEAQWYSRGRG